MTGLVVEETSYGAAAVLEDVTYPLTQAAASRLITLTRRAGQDGGDVAIAFFIDDDAFWDQLLSTDWRLLGERLFHRRTLFGRTHSIRWVVGMPMSDRSRVNVMVEAWNRSANESVYLLVLSEQDAPAMINRFEDHAGIEADNEANVMSVASASLSRGYDGETARLCARQHTAESLLEMVS